MAFQPILKKNFRILQYHPRKRDHFNSLAREDWKLIGNTTLLLNHSINRGGYL